MKSLKIFTTKNDVSVVLFFAESIQSNWDIEIFLYEDYLKEKAIPQFENDIIYLRDPFNSGLPADSLQGFLELFLDKNKKVNYVDKLSSLEDIFLEDKWYQYLVYRDFMPSTVLAAENANKEGDFVYKKRISSRSKDIYFHQPNENLEEYIMQSRLEISEEYRVLEINHVIFPQVLIKISKTEKRKTKVAGHIPIPKDLADFICLIKNKNTFDLVGYDIAKTTEGKFYLIEVNRSPQVTAFEKETGINPFFLLTESMRDL